MIPYTLLLIVGIICGIALFFRFETMDTAFVPKVRKKISIIIPARNEEYFLPKLFQCLRKQSLMPDEIICVDDDSSDYTAKIIQDFGATYVQVQEKPGDWTGKTWACQVGASAAKGEILVFLDADVQMEQETLKNIVHLHLENNNVISVQPFHEVHQFYEHFAMFFNIIGIAGNGVACPLSKKKAGLFGPVIVMNREQFNKVTTETN